MCVSSRSLLLQWALSGLLIIILLLGFSRTLDQLADKPLSDSFDQSLITFGVVRGINAIISVIQGTQVAIEPAGVGVILTPGEILDPINDLIERFSWIVLLAATSLGTQKILLGIGTTLIVQLAVSVAVVFLLVSIWRPRLLNERWRAILIRLSLLMVFLRFLIPVTVLVNEAVYRSFLNERFQSSFTVLEQAGKDIKSLRDSENTTSTVEADESLLDTISRWYNHTTRRINIEARFNEYEARLTNASEQIIDLIVVFMLHTIFFPLLFLWVGVKAGRTLINSFTWG
jgi:hypothetical protein